VIIISINCDLFIVIVTQRALPVIAIKHSFMYINSRLSACSW